MNWKEDDFRSPGSFALSSSLNIITAITFLPTSDLLPFSLLPISYLSQLLSPSFKIYSPLGSLVKTICQDESGKGEENSNSSFMNMLLKLIEKWFKE